MKKKQIIGIAICALILIAAAVIASQLLAGDGPPPTPSQLAGDDQVFGNSFMNQFWATIG